MRLDADVLVVGLGPAGGAAALAAAQGGLSVVAVEQRREIGVPVQCAEWIPLPLARHAQAPGVFAQAIDGMTTILPSGNVAHTEIPGLMVNRAAFDQALSHAALRAGVRQSLASSLKQLDTANHRAWVETPQGMLECTYRVLIAADGPRSAVARQLGLPQQPLVHARQYSVALRCPSRETRIWLSDRFPGGYAWLFPKGEVANLGVGVDKKYPGVNLKATLDWLHRQLELQGVVGGEILARSGGAIPVGGLRSPLVSGSVMLVGDAGGFTHPVTGAGIDVAVVSGERAGQAAVAWLAGEAGALHAFEQDMRDLFEAPLRRAVARRAGMVWGAGDDAMLRKGWVAFPEYFAKDEN